MFTPNRWPKFLGAVHSLLARAVVFHHFWSNPMVAVRLLSINSARRKLSERSGVDGFELCPPKEFLLSSAPPDAELSSADAHCLYSGGWRLVVRLELGLPFVPALALLASGRTTKREP